MANKENYIHELNIAYFCQTRRGKLNSRNEVNPRKLGLWLFFIYFNWISFTLSQNLNHALILDHLWIIIIHKETLTWINRYLKKKNVDSKVASPPQLYIYDASNIPLDNSSIEFIQLKMSFKPMLRTYRQNSYKKLIGDFILSVWTSILRSKHLKVSWKTVAPKIARNIH